MDFFSLLTMIGGLALFLYGMNLMGEGLSKAAGGDDTVTTQLLKEVTGKLSETKAALELLLEEEKHASAMSRGKEQAFYYHDKVMSAMNALRKPADELEKLVDKEYWPFPTYADLMFEV